MWIARDIYDTLNTRAVKAEAVRDGLIQQNQALQANSSWLMARVTELSIERAQMLKRYLNIDVPVQTFEPADTTSPADFNQVVGFEDMGDTEAKRLGISWKPDGTLEYAKA